MADSKPIGGFFELELPDIRSSYHVDAVALSTGRSCICKILEVENPSLIYVPFYTCNALFEPMQDLGIPIEFYEIDYSFRPKKLPTLKENQFLIIINYFGLNNEYVENISKKLGKRLIIDDTHRFFHRGYLRSYSFTSARKYFGVPDGAYLYSPTPIEVKNIPTFKGVQVEHAIKRLIGIQEEAFELYKKYEADLNSQINKMSILSEKLLSMIDYEDVSKNRINNFKFLHQKLEPYNQLNIDTSKMDVPFCYPLLPKNYIDKKKFYSEKIFIPNYWPDIEKRGRNLNQYKWEINLSKMLLPLPVDHRYGEEEMRKIICTTKKYISKYG